MSVEKLNSTDTRIDAFKKLNNAIDRTDTATPTKYGTLRAAAEADTLNCNCTDAAITPSNFYDLGGYRIANTQYEVDDTVACAFHSNLNLVCVQAGITSNEALNTRDVEIDQEITDGTVVWKVEEKTYGGGSMPIGTIYQAIRTDIPANSLRLDGTEYSTGFDSFVTSYLATGKVICKTMDEWQTEYTMTGAVGFFGYDSTTGAFKTPIIPEGTFLAQAVQSGNFGSFLNSEIKSHTHTQASHDHGRGTQNITGTTRGTDDNSGNWTGAFYQIDTVSDCSGSNKGSYAGFDASRSWTGRSTSETPIINATGGDDTYPKHLKYPFFVVVANTNAEEPSQTDWDNFVGNLDTKANTSLNNLDTLGQAVLNAKADKSNTLNHTQITNCILEAPTMVNVELNGGILTLKAGSKVIVPYGTSAPTMAIGDSLNGGTIVDVSWDGSKLFYIVEYANNINNSGWTSSYQNVMVALNNNGKMALDIFSKFYSGGTDPASELGLNRHYWYDTTNNIINEYVGTTLMNQYQSFPFVITNMGTSGFSAINQVFQYQGCMGMCEWVTKGVKLLLPNGRNLDRSLKNIEMTTSFVVIGIRGDDNRVAPAWIKEDGTFQFWGADIAIKWYKTRPAKPPYNFIIAYIEEENRWIQTLNDGVWTEMPPMTLINTSWADETQIHQFDPCLPFKAVDSNSIYSGEIPVAIETYKNGRSGYRLYSDGWCRQWGYTTTGGTQTLTFLKPFIRDDYILTFGMRCMYNGNLIASAAGCHTSDVNGFTFFSDNNTNKFWVAEGYVRKGY